VAVSFIGGGNRSTQRKTTDLPQVTDKLYHNVVSRNREIFLTENVRMLGEAMKSFVVIYIYNLLGDNYVSIPEPFQT